MHSRVLIRFVYLHQIVPASSLRFHYYTAKPLNEGSALANENVFILVLGLASLFVRLFAPQAFGNSRLDTRRSHLSR